MKKQVKLLLVLGWLAATAAGCAKKEVVQLDAPLPPSARASGAAGVAPETASAKRDPLSANPTPTPTPTSAVPEGSPRASIEPVAAAELVSPLENIYFDFDRYLLTDRARGTLLKTAQRLQEGSQVRITGHCDERGSDEYNLALSQRRAAAALEYLVALGVPRERLAAIGYGKERPAAPGHDEAAWAASRRDEFEFVAR